MKKFILMLIAMVAFAIGANAQGSKQQNYTGSSKFTDNWSLGLNGGIQTNLNTFNGPQGAVIGIELNKEITSIFGVTFEANAGVNNRMNWFANSSHIHNGKAIDQAYALVDGRINFMNAFCGYKGKPRFFEVEGVMGFGYGRGFSSNAVAFSKSDALLCKTGLNLNFNLDKDGAWTLKLSPSVMWNVAQFGQFNANYAVGQIALGVVHHLKSSNKKRYMTPQNPVLIEKPVDRIVEKEVVVKEKVMVESPVTIENVNNCWSVKFAQGSYTIMGDVKAIANEINKTNDSYVISGFTSPEASEGINKELGIKRATALKEALVNEGVNPDRLKIDNSYESLRTATVTVNK